MNEWMDLKTNKERRRARVLLPHVLTMGWESMPDIREGVVRLGASLSFLWNPGFRKTRQAGPEVEDTMHAAGVGNMELF